jgi:hypothetical protein
MASSKDCQYFLKEKEIQKVKSEKKYLIPWGTTIRLCREWFTCAKIICQCR